MWPFTRCKDRLFHKWRWVVHDSKCREHIEHIIRETAFAQQIESYYKETFMCVYCGAVKHHKVYGERYWEFKNTPVVEKKLVV